MDVSIRSYLSAGIAAATVGAIIGGTDPTRTGDRSGGVPSPERGGANADRTVQNAAAALRAATTQPQAAATASATAAPTLPDWTPPSINGQSIGNAIINIYNAVEPWFQWGWGGRRVGRQLSLERWRSRSTSSTTPSEPPSGGCLQPRLPARRRVLADRAHADQRSAASVNNLIVGEIAWVLSFFPTTAADRLRVRCGGLAGCGGGRGCQHRGRRDLSPESAASGIEADPDAYGSLRPHGPVQQSPHGSGSARNRRCRTRSGVGRLRQVDELSALSPRKRHHRHRMTRPHRLPSTRRATTMLYPAQIRPHRTRPVGPLVRGQRTKTDRAHRQVHRLVPGRNPPGRPGAEKRPTLKHHPPRRHPLTGRCAAPTAEPPRTRNSSTGTPSDPDRRTMSFPGRPTSESRTPPARPAAVTQIYVANRSRPTPPTPMPHSTAADHRSDGKRHRPG